VKGRTKKGSSQERSRGGQAGTGRGEDIRQTVTVREGQERAVFGATGRGEVEEREGKGKEGVEEKEVKPGRNNEWGYDDRKANKENIEPEDVELKSSNVVFFLISKFSQMTRIFLHREGEREEEEEETNNIIPDRDNKNRQRGTVYNLSHLHLCFCRTVIFLLFLVSSRILSPYLTKGISRLWRRVVVPACQDT
jgi:hypothetical protein